MTLPVVAVLPLKISGSHYDENIERTRLLLDSFDRFLELPEPLAVTAICVPAEMAAVRAALSSPRRSVRLDVISENEVIPGISEHRAIGWYKQQALKLAYSARCPSPFYLTLDPDVLLIRPLRLGDLVNDGRCYTSWMTKAEHPHWWDASASVLDVTADPARRGLNVTPNLLSSDVARALGHALTTRLASDAPWLALLDVDKTWTEYTLYSVFAETSGLLARHHRDDLPQGRRLLGRSVWTPENFENYSLDAIHADPNGAFFTVCASHTGVSAATVREMFETLVIERASKAA